MASARMTIDHDEIRRWAEDRNAAPSCVLGTGDSNDTGMIRLDFPGYSGEGKLQPIGWDEWFQRFDENGLGLLIQDETASGEKSNFNKLVSRDDPKAKGQSSKKGGSKGTSGTKERSGHSKASSRAKTSKETTRGKEGERKSGSSSLGESDSGGKGRTRSS